MKHIAMAALLLLTSISTCLAASDEEIYNQINTIHGQADALDGVLPQVREAFASGDAAAIATLSSFPLPVKANGEAYDINNGDDLVKYFDTLVTQETRDALAGMEYGDIIVNSSGVGLGNGAVWLGFVCEDSACADGNWLVTAINN